jgi:hypothetical protein
VYARADLSGTVTCVWAWVQIGHAYRQRRKMKQVVRAQEGDFDFVMHVNDVRT